MRAQPKSSMVSSSRSNLRRAIDDPRDVTWEADLISLLVELESARATLDDMPRSDTSAALDYVGKLANQLVGFAEAKMPESPEVLTCMAKAGDFFSSNRELVDAVKPSMWKSFRGMFGKGADDAARTEQLRAHLAETTPLFDDFATLFSAQFRGEPARARWKETAGVFSNELSRVVAAFA